MVSRINRDVTSSHNYFPNTGKFAMMNTFRPQEYENNHHLYSNMFRGTKRVKLLIALYTLIAVLGITEYAEAQFKHWSIGASLGIQNTFNQAGDPSAPEGTRANLGYGVGISYLSLGIEGSWRFETNWAVNFETLLSFHSCGTPTATNPNAVCGGDYKTPVMLAVLIDLRYYFITDEFRPFIDVGIAYWQSIGLVRSNISAPTLTLGFDWFFKEDLALGLRMRYGMQVMVEPAQLFIFHQIMALATFNAYF
jgi:hypothetical protein